MSLSRSRFGHHEASGRERVGEEGSKIVGPGESMHTVTDAAQQPEENVHHRLRTQVVGRNVLAGRDESDELPLALFGHADETLKKARFSVEGREEVGMFLSRAFERTEVLDGQLEQIVDDNGPAAGSPGQEFAREDLGLGVGIDSDDRVFLGAEVVEEGAARDAHLVAELLDGETGKATLRGEPPRDRGQAGGRLSPAQLSPIGRCTFIHRVQYCTLPSMVQSGTKSARSRPRAHLSGDPRDVCGTDPAASADEPCALG